MNKPTAFCMKNSWISIVGPVIGILLMSLCGAAQQTPAQSAPSDNEAHGVTTVHGCLDRSRGNYLVIEDQTSLIYVLKGVGNKLNRQVHHQVEVHGQLLPGTVKTGIRSEKSGSNPSDTVHGIDGLPLQVANVQTDVRVIANHCKAADQQ